MKSIEEKIFPEFATRMIGALVSFQKTGECEKDHYDYQIKLAKNMSLLKEAQSLMSEPEDPNPEYDRGICELLAIQLGLPLQAVDKKDCGAYKIGDLINCHTVDDWGKITSRYEPLPKTSHDKHLGIVHGSAFCRDAIWENDSTTNDLAKITCSLCKVQCR